MNTVRINGQDYTSSLSDAEIAFMGNLSLPTTAQTLSGAIAEHETDISELNSNLVKTATLWSNPNTGTSFSAQNIELTDSVLNYKFICIEFRSKTTSSAYTTIFVPSMALALNLIGYSFFGGAITSRAVQYIENGTKLAFSDATNTTVDNTLAIPSRVSGFIER